MSRRYTRLTICGILGVILAVGSNIGAGAASPAFSVQMVKDINSLPTRFIPSGVAQLGSRVVFTSGIYDGYISSESVWVTDGTTAGTKPFVIPNNPDGFPASFTPAGAKDYFVVYYPSKSPELWRTDGNPTGTNLVKKFPQADDLISLVIVNGKLYFLEVENYTNYYLWTSDGTAAGTTRIKQIPENIPSILYAPNAKLAGGARVIGNQAYASGGGLVADRSAFFQYSAPHLVVVGSELYIVANSPATGAELWKSDGTASGTGLVKDIDAGPDSSNPQDLTPVGNRLFFTADDGIHGPQIWVSNGTASGTTMTRYIPHGQPGSLVSTGNGALFVATKACLSPSGICHNADLGPGLWTTDGTVQGTRLLKLVSGQAGDTVGNVAMLSTGSPVGVFIVTNRYRQAHTVKAARRDSGRPPKGLPAPGNTGHGQVKYVYIQQLWRTDGTAGGTAYLKAINRHVDSGISGFTRIVTSGHAFELFAANDGIHGAELWRTDGTGAGTELVKDIQPGGGSSAPTGLSTVTITGSQAVLFAADDGVHGPQLWSSDGAASGTRMIATFNKGTASSNPSTLTPLGNGLDFYATGPATRGSSQATFNIYRTRGTAQSTVVLRRPHGNPGNVVDLGNRAVYICENRPHSVDLCRFGTSAATTGRYIRIQFPKKGSQFFNPTLVGGGTHAFILAGRRIWVTDGTTGGTRLVSTFAPYTAVDGGPFASRGKTLFFTIRRRHATEEIWQTDGTRSGTFELRSLRLSTRHSQVNGLLAVPGSRLMYVVEFQPGRGTVLLLYGASHSPRLLTALRQVNAPTLSGRRLFFIGADGLHGNELWMSDGTAHGTRMVRDIRPGLGGSGITDMVPFNGGVVFAASDGRHGSEPWFSDGTANGTHLIKDLNPGPSSSSPFGFTAYAGLAFFVADSSATGWSLFTTNGTAAGTRTMRPLLGFSQYSISPPTVANGILYFSSLDSRHGTELWKVRR